MKKFKSKWEEIYERLEAEGKVTVLSVEEVAAIDEHIRKSMEGFKQDLRRKEAKSWQDNKRIILNA